MLNASDLSNALRRAFNLGQTYWQQADSEYTSQHRKADETRAKFEALVAETVAAAGVPMLDERQSFLQWARNTGKHDFYVLSSAAWDAWQARAAAGVTPTVPVNRPATAAEAQHAARIGACLPNGVLFDAFGNPRKRYTRVSLDGAHLILDDVQLADFKASQTDDPEQYTYSDVYLSQEEADALPEFDGF